MITEFDNCVRVAFPTEREANNAIAFMQVKIKDSIGHWASVYDLVGCCSITPDFAYRFTSGELNDWGWTSIDGYSLQKGPIRNIIILSMPPARKRGMINPNLHQIMEEKYYPLTPPPQPYKEMHVNIPRACGKTMLSMKVIEDICKNTKLREEINSKIIKYSEIAFDGFRYILEYRNPSNGPKYRLEYKIPFDSPCFLEFWPDEETDKYFDEQGNKARKELIDRVIKDMNKGDANNMFLNNSDAVYEKIYKYATNFEIENALLPAGCCSTATIECPVHNLNGLLGLEDNTAKKSKPVKSVEIANIEMYNDRVVKVTFDDGSFTKSVCQENDIFDLDVGITVCLMKKMLDSGKGDGTRIYNDIIRDAHKLINDKENEKIEQQLEKEKLKKKAHKAMMKRQAKKLKAKEEAIDIQKQAFIRAMQETGMVNDGK